MKARTKFEKAVVASNGRLTAVTQKQIDWAFAKCIEHVAFRNVKGDVVCGDCGHQFSYAGKAKTIRCPQCGRTLTINDTKKRTFEKKAYFSILCVQDHIQVQRVFLLSVKYRKGGEIGACWDSMRTA